MQKLTKIVDLLALFSTCIDNPSTSPIRTSLANNPQRTGVMSSVTPGYGDTSLLGCACENQHLEIANKALLLCIIENVKERFLIQIWIFTKKNLVRVSMIVF